MLCRAAEERECLVSTEWHDERLLEIVGTTRRMYLTLPICSLTTGW